MIRYVAVIFLVMISVAPARAAETSDARAVGLLELGGHGGCTATLIEPSVVLTAAHCLLTMADGERLAADAYTFHPSNERGEPGPGFRGKRIAVHPVFLLPGLSDVRRVSRDVALLQLERPVPPEVATPMATAKLDEPPVKVFIISFRGPEGGPARQRICPLIAFASEVMELGCDVHKGESGAPVITREKGRLALAGVVSSRSQQGRQPVALAPSVRTALAGLKEAFRLN